MCGGATVTILSPADGATVSGQVEISADVDSDTTVLQVEFYVDNQSVGVDTDGTDGWSVLWDSNGVADGAHTIEVEAIDQLGGTGSAGISITTANGERWVPPCMSVT